MEEINVCDVADVGTSLSNAGVLCHYGPAVFESDVRTATLMPRRHYAANHNARCVAGFSGWPADG